MKEYREKFSAQLGNWRDYEFSHAELQNFFLAARTLQCASETFGDWVEREHKNKAENHKVESQEEVQSREKVQDDV